MSFKLQLSPYPRVAGDLCSPTSHSHGGGKARGLEDCTDEGERDIVAVEFSSCLCLLHKALELYVGSAL